MKESRAFLREGIIRSSGNELNITYIHENIIKHFLLLADAMDAPLSH